MKFFPSEAPPPFENVALTSHHEVAHCHLVEEEEVVVALSLEHQVAHAHPFEEEKMARVTREDNEQV
jgi:hypothetical protein